MNPRRATARSAASVVAISQAIAIAVMLPLLMGLLLAAPSHGHEFWINQGKYTSPSAARYHESEHCCGTRDCRAVIKDKHFVARGDFWIFLEGEIAEWARMMWATDIAGQTWPRDVSQTYRSEDDQHWVCIGPTGVRCFFYDYGGY